MADRDFLLTLVKGRSLESSAVPAAERSEHLVIQTQTPLFDQLQHGHRGDRLGETGDAEQAVLCGRFLLSTSA